MTTTIDAGAMTVTCDYCHRTVYMAGRHIYRQLLDYGSANACPPCENEWKTI